MAPKRKAEDAPARASKRAKTAPKPKAVSKPKAAPRKASPPKTSKKPVKKVLNAVPRERLALYTFGEGSAGELGQGSKGKDMNIKRPRLVKNLPALIDISCGGMHSIALTGDNQILTWGVNDQGALGRDTTWSGGLRDVDADDSDSDEEPDSDKLNPKEATPTAIPASAFPAGTTFTQVAASDSASFALTDDGKVYGWGTFRNNEGIFGFTAEGLKEKKLIQDRPIHIPKISNITQITCGANHTLALDNKGAVYAWGAGQQHQLGRKTVERHQDRNLEPAPVPFIRGKAGIPTGAKIKTISSGDYHSFAIDDRDNVYTWGLNSYGETGIPEGVADDGAIITGPKKAKNLSGRGVKQIAGGSHHSAAITNNGNVLVWGRMDGGQLGLDTKMIDIDDEESVTKDSSGRPRIMLKPAQVPDLNGKYIACGPEHCIAITTDGKAYSWGFNANYQLAQGHSDDINTPTLIDNTAIRDIKLVWAGCGGQYGALAAPAPSTTTAA